MKPKSLLQVSLRLLPWLCCLQAAAQNYSIDWHKIAGGGGTSTNGPYALSGTIGQPDAGATMSCGSYTLSGGFWSLIALQTPGAPDLSIFSTSSNAVVLSWPAPSTGFVLQQTPTLQQPNWTDVAATPVLVGSQNQVMISAPTGNRFYRLKK